ncbi:MAG: hypothetical protein KBG17_01340 [Paludibacteraceae bacterium]|nr:hypothetical protein [Paludibacteraceae bacterium]
MRSVELAKKIGDIRDKGFIKTLRNGPTGIGHLLETELGLSETNIAIPDIGGRVELKATRKNANSLITLFTFNRAVWKVKQYDLIEKYGYLDTYGRKALYTTVNVKFPNNQGFYLLIDKQKNLVMLRNINENMNIAEWSSYVLAGKFMTKLDRLLFVLADNKLENDIEYFHFNEAYLLENPTPEKFLEAFEKNELMIDIRMHLKDSNGVRNHGTALRMSEKNLIDLYTQKRQLI